MISACVYANTIDNFIMHVGVTHQSFIIKLSDPCDILKPNNNYFKYFYLFIHFTSSLILNCIKTNIEYVSFKKIIIIIY